MPVIREPPQEPRPVAEGKVIMPVSPEKLPRRRKPTLANVLRQARKAEVPIKRVRVEPDGAVTLDVGEPEPTEATNPWLAEIERTTKR